MKKIVLISCVSKKSESKKKARDLYQSTLFKLSLAYAEKLNPDKIYILSAKHHLLDLETEIEPYDVTLSNMRVQERKVWGEKVIEQLRQVADLRKDEFIILAGKNYIQPICKYLTNIDSRLDGLQIGKRLSFLKNEVQNDQGE